MPLLNILVLCGNGPPTVVSNLDFTSHMIDEWKAWFKTESWWIVFFDGASTAQTSGAIYVQVILEQCVFMEASKFFHSFSVISPNTNPYRLVYVWMLFISLYFLIIFQLLVVKSCRFHNVFGSGISNGMYEGFIAQATILNYEKRFTAMCRKKVWHLVLCFVQTYNAEASIDGHNLQHIAWQSFKVCLCCSCNQRYGGCSFAEGGKQFLVFSVLCFLLWKR